MTLFDIGPAYLRCGRFLVRSSLGESNDRPLCLLLAVEVAHNGAPLRPSAVQWRAPQR